MPAIMSGFDAGIGQHAHHADVRGALGATRSECQSELQLSHGPASRGVPTIRIVRGLWNMSPIGVNVYRVEFVKLGEIGDR